MKLLVLNGPNINLLGVREPHIYGNQTYENLLDCVHKKAQELGIEVICFQSNHEGDLIDKIHEVYMEVGGIVINPGGYTHTSIALLDALKAVGLPAVEVHISKIDEREAFRQVSYVGLYCKKTITGCGIQGYARAMEFLSTGL